MIKVLVVGSDEIWAVENVYFNFFSKVADCSRYNAHGIFLAYYEQSLKNKLLYRLGWSSIIRKINNDLLQKVEIESPDVVLIFKGMEILPKTLRKIKNKGVKLINYNGDHPFEFVSRGSGNTNVLRSIPLYDLHLSYSQTIVSRIKSEFGIEAKWLPFGYYNSSAPVLTSQLIERLCFIGNPDDERVRLINMLSEHGVLLDVFGSNWRKWLKTESENIRAFPSLYKEEFNKTAQKYKAHINIFRLHNKGSHNMRTFELAALGCAVLAPRSQEHMQLYKENDEILFYETDRELINGARDVLSLPEFEINRIRINAYKRSVNSGYSYEARAKFAFDEIKKVVEAK